MSKTTESLQKPLFMPPPQPDTSTNAPIALTMTLSDSKAKHRKKKNKKAKARDRAKSSAQAANTPIEPFIAADAVQNEPAPPFAIETPTEPFIAADAVQSEPAPPFTTETPTEPFITADEVQSEPAPSFITETPTEPFIAVDTVQSELAPPFATETFPPISLERDDRIVVRPPYSGSSSDSTRFSTHPVAYGLAALILIVFLGGLWWWNASETNPSPEDADTRTQLTTLPSKPPSDIEPFPTPSAPASSVENTPEPDLEQILGQEPGSESGWEQELMGIPPLPMNQQQGRHNQYNPINLTETKNAPPHSPLP